MATKAKQQTRRNGTSGRNPPNDPATEYALDVTAGRIIAGPHVRDACHRHLRDLEEGPARGLTWDTDSAERILGFFRDALRLSGGEFEDVPFDPHPWQAFILGSLFGWKGPDGFRRFRMAFVETGKGSGKSPLAAGIGKYMLCADGEPRAEIYSAAVDKEQAGVLFRDAVAMAKLSPAIRGRVTFSGGAGREYNIALPATGSFFRPISSESTGRGKSGYRPHGVLLDEIHEHPTNAMVEFMRAGTKGRKQALIFMITNSGVDRTSVCYEYHEYATKVAAGDLKDDSFFGFVCSSDEGEDPFTDPVDKELGYPPSWAKTNPSLQVEPSRRTFQPKYLEEQVRQAKGMPSKESIVRRLNFCEWVDAENPWIDGDLWRSCEVGAEDFPETAYLPHAIALDLSSKRDLTAAARAVELPDGTIAAELRFWTPGDSLEERERTDRVPYSAWVRNGHLTAVPGRTIGYAHVVRDIADWLSADDARLAFDPWRIDDFQRELDDAGVDSWLFDGPEGTTGQGLMMVRHGQGWGGGANDKTLWMPRSIGELEERILEQTLKVRKNPVLTWNSASAVLEQDAAENKKWSKRKSTGRIDGVVALSMAVGLLTGLPDMGVVTPQVLIMEDGDADPGEEEQWW